MPTRARCRSCSTDGKDSPPSLSELECSSEKECHVSACHEEPSGSGLERVVFSPCDTPPRILTQSLTRSIEQTKSGYGNGQAGIPTANVGIWEKTRRSQKKDLERRGLKLEGLLLLSGVKDGTTNAEGKDVTVCDERERRLGTNTQQQAGR